MKIGESIQCPACGASSVIKHNDQSIIECEYCGSMMRFTADAAANTKTKPAHLTLLLVMLPVIVVVLMVVFWLVFQNIREQSKITQPAEQLLAVKTQSINTPQGIAYKPNNKTPSELKQQLQIQSQVKGQTSSGGLYWIVGVVNTGPDAVSRPGIMLSAFNQGGQRVVEQGGWSTDTLLAKGDKATVLVFIKEPPEDINSVQLSTLANQPNQSSENQLSLSIRAYQMTEKNGFYEFVGDVFNANEVNARYTRVVVVALNGEGEPIGIGNAFSTNKNLAPKASSGFKVTVGTFLTAEPVTWELVAFARQ